MKEARLRFFFLTNKSILSSFLHSQAIDFDWCVLARVVEERYGKRVREGTPDSYWVKAQPTPHVSINAERAQSYRVTFFTHYNSTAEGIFQTAANQNVAKPWTRPLWLDKTSSKCINVFLDGVQHPLFLYCYHLHNIHFLEVFDAIPTLLLSPLFSRSLQIRHFVKANYLNPSYNGTDSERSTDSSIDSSLSYIDLSFTQGATSAFDPSNKSYQMFATQSIADTTELANQILYQPPYMNGNNLQVLIDVSSVSLSFYEMQNGVYRELVHFVAQTLQFSLQRGVPELFSGHS